MTKISSNIPAHALPMRHLLSEFEQYADVLREADANRKLSTAKLREKVLAGRDEQNQLTEAIDAARAMGRKAAKKLQQRQVAHIKTILSRAELLTRPKVKSVSRYAGDEGRYDDLNLLERAKGFMLIAAGEGVAPAKRAKLMDHAERFAAAQDKVTLAEY